MHLLLNLTKLLSNKKILSQEERDEKVSIFCFSLRAFMKIVESVFKLEKLFPDVQRLTFFLCLNYEEKFLNLHFFLLLFMIFGSESSKISQNEVLRS